MLKMTAKLNRIKYRHGTSRRLNNRIVREKAFTISLQKMGIEILPLSDNLKREKRRQNWFINMEDNPGVMVLGNLKKRA